MELLLLLLLLILLQLLQLLYLLNRHVLSSLDFCHLLLLRAIHISAITRLATALSISRHVGAITIRTTPRL